jgi:hypothetical protein
MIMILVTPKAGTKHELLFNKPVSDKPNFAIYLKEPFAK